jgi:1-acyl-sn-glycerol-3-phosphate acyltransferase
MKAYHKELVRVSNKVRAFIEGAFTETVYDGPALSREMIERSSIIIACTHRSQFDYFIIGNYMHFLGVPNIRFAAGDNLTELPYLGKKFRNFGAFTVRREMALRKSYLRTLCNEVVAMLEDDDSIVVFPEMGRSYSGHMLKVRTLMLGAHVIDQMRRPDRPHIIIPSAISYEQLPELPYFEMLDQGKKLRQRGGGPLARIVGGAKYYGADIIAFGKLIAGRKLGRRIGRLYVDYGEPIDLRDILDLSAARDGKSRDELFAHRETMQALSDMLREKFYGLYRLLPMHVVAGILAEAGGAVSTADVARRIPAVIEGLRGQDRNLKSIAGLKPRELLDEAIRQLRVTRSITISGDTLRWAKPSIIQYHAASLEKR